MAIFGSEWRSKLPAFGAGMYDIGSTLRGQSSDRLGELRREREMQAGLDRLGGVMFPQGGSQPMTQQGAQIPMPTTAAGLPEGQMGKADGYGIQQAPMPQPQMQQQGQPDPNAFWQELFNLSRQGVNVAPYAALYEQMNPEPEPEPQPRFEKVGNNLVRIDPRTGQAETAWSAPVDETPMEYQAINRDQGIYRFNPRTGQVELAASAPKIFAPPRVSRTASAPPPPAGFVLD